MSVSGKRLISGSSHAFPFGKWASAVVFAGIAAGIFLANSPQPTAAQQNILLAAVSLTGLIAIGVFGQATLATLRYCRFRGLKLELTPKTAVTGGEFTGTLLTPIPFQAGREFKAALSAVELTAESYKDAYREVTRPLYSAAGTTSAEAAGAGTLLRFAFILPADAAPSRGYGESVKWTAENANRVYVKWRLDLSANVPGVDLDEVFEIPVVRPGASELPLPAGHNPSFVIARAANALSIMQPAGKKPGKPGSAADMLGAGTLGGVILLGLDIGGFIGGVLFVAGVVLTAAIVAYLAHELAVTISPAELRVVRRIGKHTLMDVRIECSRIRAVEAIPAFGRYADGVPARTVRVRTEDGQTYALAEFMTRTRDVLALCNLVAVRLGLGPQAIVGAAELQRTLPPHVYEATEPPGVRLVGGLIVLAIAGLIVWPWFDALYEANWGDGKATKVVAAQPAVPAGAPPSGAPAVAGRPVVAVGTPIPSASAADATGTRWWPRFEHANAEISARRFDAAEQEFQRILLDIERESGPGHPYAGLLHYHLAMNYGNQRRKADRETALKRALDIFERQPVKAVKAALGSMGWFIDKESAARELGDLLWEWQRTADAFAYYEKAYAAVAELDTTEDVRNERLALSAAGVMVTSCTLQKWDIADKAMADLKQRYPTVAAGTQPRLKYWIDSGEPRLKARQC